MLLQLKLKLSTDECKKLARTENKYLVNSSYIQIPNMKTLKDKQNITTIKWNC